LFSIIVDFESDTLLLVTEVDEGDPGFLHLTEEEIATGVVKASAMEEGSDNELDELQEPTIKKKLLSCIRDGIGAVICGLFRKPRIACIL
jgi:hypothetical protein